MTDFLGPFVESKTAGAAVVGWVAENQVGGGHAILNGVENACADAENAVIVDKHRVVVPEGAVRWDALVVSVGDGGRKSSNFGSRGWRWQYDPVSEISGELDKVGDVGVRRVSRRRMGSCGYQRSVWFGCYVEIVSSGAGVDDRGMMSLGRWGDYGGLIF